MNETIEQEFKVKVRDTLVEMLDTDRETFYPLFMGKMEDMAMVRAMEEGEKSPEVEEKNILSILQK